MQQQPQRGAKEPPPSGAQQQPRAQKQQQRLQQPPRLCTVCGKRGHSRENCFAASKSADQGDTQAGSRRCYNCDEEGHISRRCPHKQKPTVKFAAASRARKSSKKPAVVSDDDDYWTAADTERVRHGAAAHAEADSSQSFVCMARSARALSDFVGMRPVYLDNAANIAVTGDMSVFDGPLMAASPVWVNTAEKGGGKTFVDKAAPAFGLDIVYYNPGCPMTLLPYYELLDRYPIDALRKTKTSTSWDDTPYFFERTSYNMFRLSNAAAVRRAFALKQQVVQEFDAVHGPVLKILFDAPSLVAAATVNPSVDVVVPSTPDVATAKLWRLHRAFGHISIVRLKELLRSGAITVPGISYDDIKYAVLDQVCLVCAMGKATRLPFPAAPLAHSVPPGNTWFVDLSGPLPVGAYGHGNAKYVMLFVDAFTRVKCLYLLKTKADALIGFSKFFQWIFEQNITVRQLRSDRGGEFVGTGVLNFLATKNIVLHQSATGDSETQGSIERQFRTLWNSIRCMLLDQDLPASYWGLAALYSVYIDNRSLANTDDVTRLELLTGRPPHVERVHVFGGPVVWIPSLKINTEGKLAPRGRMGIYLGVDGSQTLIFDISARKLQHTRNLTFIHVPMRPTFDLAHRKDKIDSWLGKMSDKCVTTDDKDFPGASRIVTDIQAEHARGAPQRTLPTRGNTVAVEG